MPDYKLEVHGHYSAAVTWSFGCHVNSAQDLATILTTWKTAWEATWSDAGHGLNILYPATTGIDEYRAYTLDSLMYSTAAATSGSTKVGTGTADSLPWEVSIVVSQRTAQTGPAGRGRLKLPAIIETSVNNNVLDSGDAGRISTAVNAVKSAINADGSTVFVVKHGRRASAKVPVAIPAGPKYTVLTWKVSDKPASQKNRVRKIKGVYH